MSRAIALRAVVFLAVAALSVLAVPSDGVKAAQTNNGTEFIIAFPETDNYRFLAIGGSSATTATWSQPGQGIGPTNLALTAGSLTVIGGPTIPPQPVALSGSGTIEDKGILVTSPDDVAVFALAGYAWASDGYMALPTAVTGTRFVVPSYDRLIWMTEFHFPSQVAIAATADDTVVTITPASSMVPGADTPASLPAGVAFSVSLDRLQAMNLQSDPPDTLDSGDLTGTIIESDKPISVFGSHLEAFVPVTAAAANHLVEQIPPTNTWGCNFYTVPLATRSGGDIFRVLAQADGTVVERDGVLLATLDEGEFTELVIPSTAYSQISASSPILLEQYSQGSTVDGVEKSDPFMMTVLAREQYRTEYLFDNFGSVQPLSPYPYDNFINIVAPSASTAGLLLDGATISTSWTTIGSSGFSGAQLSVTPGSHSVTHSSPGTRFGVQVYAYAEDEGYGYPAGFETPVDCSPPPSCAPTEPVSLDSGLNLTPNSGSPDPAWTVTSGPTIGAAYPVAVYPGWVTPPASHTWIDPNNTSLTNDPIGTYRYERQFSVPSGTTSLTMAFQFAVDNDVVFRLDGVAIPGATLSGGAPSHFTTLHTSPNYVVAYPTPGVHTVSADVYSATGPVGLLVDGTVSCSTTPSGGCAIGEAGAGASASSAQCRFVNVDICYEGAPPTGSLGCGVGSSKTVVPASTLLTQYTLLDIPTGNRLADCGAHFVRDLACGRSLSVTYTPGAWTYATPPGDWGDIYGYTDAFCNAQHDVLAGNGPGGAPIQWPDPSKWTPFTTSGTPMPPWMNNGDSRLIPPSFAVLGNEQANVTRLYIDGTGAFAPPALFPWLITTAASPYQAGLKLTWNVIGDPTKPPRVNDLCVDSRWAHVHTNDSQWTSPPSPGLYPRWTIVQTMQDIRSGIIHRTIDLHCVGVTPVPPDADGDCLEDSADVNDANRDQDGDFVVDGIEVANGSSPTSPDFDADGATDFDELFTFTNPNVPDTDGDGSADKLDTTADEVPTTKTVDDDTAVDDNCPAVANPPAATQLNTDFLPFASGGAHYGDRTQPQQDWMGDPCDRDRDNDHAYNVSESGLIMSASNCASGVGVTDALKADQDRSVGSGADQAIDGAECAFGGDPTSYLTTIGICTVPTDSPDIDRLCYAPNAAFHQVVETFWRTRDISMFTGDLEFGCPAPAHIPACADAVVGENDKDSDGDGLVDGTEIKYYGTNPSNADTDSDGCPDGKEVADINGDNNTNSIDQGLLASTIIGGLSPWDTTRIARDLSKDGVVNSIDQAFLATFVILGTQCPARSGIIITKSMQ